MIEQPFTVTIPVARNLEWAQITEGINLYGIEEQYHSRMRSHFAYLLRQAGWGYGIDWSPIDDVVTLVVPNELYTERQIQGDGIYVDGLSAQLYAIMEQVNFVTVRKHFVSR